MTTQQDDWSKWLAIASLMHNSRVNATIKMAPLQALLGYFPRLMAEASTLSTNQKVEEQAEEMTRQREQAWTTLAQCAQGMPLDQFTPGDQVWLEVKHLKLPYQAPKLVPKHHGPFIIRKRVSPVTYQLQLPLAWAIYDVFHASLLTITKARSMAPTTRGHHLILLLKKQSTKWRASLITTFMDVHVPSNTSSIGRATQTPITHGNQ